MVQVKRLQHASVPMPTGMQDEARAFYAGVLGLPELDPPDALHPLGVVWFQASDAGDEIHLYEEPTGARQAPGQHFCLQVDDVKAFAEHLASHGARIEEPIALPGRPRFNTWDPFGNQIEIFQMEDHPEAIRKVKLSQASAGRR
jgi:catechol 2,3-dioxygenase-like lactoylglutathione lyase family enzyme